MFDFLKRKAPHIPSSVSAQMRDLMFGDIPWNQWCKPTLPDIEPWLTFKSARGALDRGDSKAAITFLRMIVGTQGHESRCYLQAWHYLRELNEKPADPKHILGVIIEVGLNGGLDVLGAYEDHTARYWNFSGKGIVWEHPDGSVDSEIDALFKASKLTVVRIGPWDKPRVTGLEKGMVRVSFLTPSGIHFGQGSLTSLAKDDLAGPVIQRGTALMLKLIAKSKNA